MKKRFRVGLALCAIWVAAVPESLAGEFPDVVRLKNGGIVRGTIIEYVPGDHVRIELSDGTERHFAGTEVDYAGSTAAESPVPPPVTTPVDGVPASVNLTHSTVKLEGTSGLTLHVRTASQQSETSGTTWSTRGGFGVYNGTTESETYQPVCTVPCTASIQNGRQKFALSSGDGSPVAVESPITVTGPSTLEGHYASRQNIRTGGGVLMTFGVGMVVVAGVAARNCSRDDDCDRGPAIGVGALGLFVVIAGAVMAVQRDEATITLIPGVSAARWRHGMLAQERPSGGTPTGLTASIAF